MGDYYEIPIAQGADLCGRQAGVQADHCPKSEGRVILLDSRQKLKFLILCKRLLCQCVPELLELRIDLVVSFFNGFIQQVAQEIPDIKKNLIPELITAHDRVFHEQIHRCCIVLFQRAADLEFFNRRTSNEPIYFFAPHIFWGNASRAAHIPEGSEADRCILLVLLTNHSYGSLVNSWRKNGCIPNP